MNYIEQLEIDIVAQLKNIEDEKIFVHSSPESDSERPDQSGVESNVFVMYTGSRFGEPRSTNEVSQDEFFQFAVVMESPYLRGEFGIYQLKKKVSDSLLGFEPSNANKMTLVSTGFNAEKMIQNEGVFTFTTIFETRGMAVQAIPVPDDWGVVKIVDVNVEAVEPPKPPVVPVFLTTEENEILITEENENITL